MKTIQAVAETLGVHSRTVKRHIERLNGELLQINGGNPFSFGISDPLPEPVSEYLISNIVKHGPPKPLKSDNSGTAVKTEIVPDKKPALRVAAQVKVGRPADEIVFKNKAFLIACAAILIGVDSLSFAWIAWNTYPSFREAAACVFALAGMATGYSAIKNILSYKGWNGDAWAWGFGLFQLCLHLCAMEVLGDWSFFLGKIVISVGLPLATAGLATALKMDK